MDLYKTVGLAELDPPYGALLYFSVPSVGKKTHWEPPPWLIQK